MRCTAMSDDAHRIFVSYIDKSREYYSAQGYDAPYRWAHFEDVPFAPLSKPLGECRVGLVTTAELEKRAFVGAGNAYAAPVSPPPERLHTQHLGWDQETTHTNDVETFLPIRKLAELVAARRIGSLSPRFYGVPTDYSHRRTIEEHAPATLRFCREDRVDVAILAAL
ncbi:MAG: hypothetical protein ACREQQ_17255 [Candidatus Binatia bacterium]